MVADGAEHRVLALAEVKGARALLPRRDGHERQDDLVVDADAQRVAEPAVVGDGERELAAGRADVLRADQVVVERDREGVGALAGRRALAAAGEREEGEQGQRAGAHRSPMLSHPMTRARRVLLIATALALAAGGVVACGEENIDVAANERNAASNFDEHCSGCHTLGVAGTQGSATNVRTREYKDGPNFDQRKETKNCVLYAIRNGGFSSGPMPQDIETGQEAEELANFLAKYSGSKRPQTPGIKVRTVDCPAA